MMGRSRDGRGHRHPLYRLLSFMVLFIAAAFLNYKRDKLTLQEEIDRSLDFEFQQKV
jgi:hypothetical protein